MTENSVPQKRCKDCLQEFPETREYFYFHHKCFDTRCKTCYSIRYGHKPNKKYPEGYWECGTCHELLPLTDEYFTPNKKRKRGLRYECKKCNAKRSAKFYDENKDEINRRSRERLKIDEEYRTRKRRIAKQSANKRKDKTRLYNQQWQQDNWAYILEYKRQWKKRNPEKVRQSGNAYRIVRVARIRGNGGKSTTKQIQELYFKQNGKCYWCGIETNDKYEIDHIHPVSKGGTSSIDNLCVSCKRCNRLKSNLTVEQWLIKLKKIQSR